MSNIQVTHDASANNARSESAIAINPNNPQQIAAASKKFRNLQTYDFTLASAFSTDGGNTWNDSADFAMRWRAVGLDLGMDKPSSLFSCPSKVSSE